MSASEVHIQTVAPGDMAQLMTALQALARDLNDPFTVTSDDMAAALFGPDSFALALLARQGDTLCGAALAAPLFSTLGGGATLYVSDLWVEPSVRQHALGTRLLSAASAEGERRWQTSGLRLTVYSDNAPARAFYERLGFIENEKDLSAFLPGASVAALQTEASCA